MKESARKKFVDILIVEFSRSWWQWRPLSQRVYSVLEKMDKQDVMVAPRGPFAVIYDFPDVDGVVQQCYADDFGSAEAARICFRSAYPLGEEDGATNARVVVELGSADEVSFCD